ncbi:MAG: thioesterase family protein [Oleibacter sp.]|nr:thioesterase family protein [Thalassolituus sp.]
MLDLYDYPVVIELPVLWGEMDVFQHVNNVAYFRYFESVRVKYYETVQFQNVLDGYSKGPVLAEIKSQFLAQLKYPDTISVGIKTIKMGASSLLQEYGVWSHETSRLVAKGESKMVFYDFTSGRPCAMPKALRDNILKLEPYLVKEKTITSFRQ